jgi:molybdopterin converting factor small subunit
VTRVRIPPTLRAEVGGVREIEAEGDTVGDVIEDLVERHPALRPQLFQNGGIGSFVNVFLGGEDIRTLDGLETPVDRGSTVILLPAMAGGAPTHPAGRGRRAS